jgi:hypothetical protein
MVWSNGRGRLGPAILIDGFSAAAVRWRLTRDEADQLLGCSPGGSLGLIAGRIDPDEALIRRLSLLLDIEILTRRLLNQSADGFLRVAQHDLGGRTPLQLMLEGVDGQLRVRSMVLRRLRAAAGSGA